MNDLLPSFAGVSTGLNQKNQKRPSPNHSIDEGDCHLRVTSRSSNFRRNHRHTKYHRRTRSSSVGNSNYKPFQEDGAVPRRIDALKCIVCGTNDSKYKCPRCRAPYCSVACCRQHKSAQESESWFCRGVASCSDSCGEERLVNSNNEQSSCEKQSRYKHELERANKLFGHRFKSHHLQHHYHEDSSFEDLDEDWRITEAMVTSICVNEWIRTEVQKPHLQQLIHMITSASKKVSLRHDAATGQEALLDLLKADLPLFSLFLDKLLVVAGVLERVNAGDGNKINYTNDVDDVNSDVEDWLKSDHGSPLHAIFHPVPRTPRLSFENCAHRIEIPDEVSSSSSSSSESESSFIDSAGSVHSSASSAETSSKGSKPK